MKPINLISIQSICHHYDVEITFFNSLNEYGLIELTIIDEEPYLQKSKIKNIEKLIRLHHELGINMEGIDVISNLTEKINSLHKEIDFLKNRIIFYEE